MNNLTRLLKEAKAEIQELRAENAILKEKVDTMNLFQRVFDRPVLNLGYSPSKPDVAWNLATEIAHLEANDLMAEAEAARGTAKVKVKRPVSLKTARQKRRA